MRSSTIRSGAFLAVLTAISLHMVEPALAVPPTASRGAAVRPPRAAEPKTRLGIRETLRAARKELHVYRGRTLERMGDFLTLRRSTFDKTKSVAQNLEAVVQKKGIPHYYKEINGRKVLHVVVDLGQGKTSKKAVREVFRRIGRESIELNYKAPTKKNTYGHVAVRVGLGATYDLTGTRGVAQLPRPLERAIQAISGKSDLTFARKRNLRRFMESRKEKPQSEGDLYYGLIFGANTEGLHETRALYEKRLGEITSFSVSGGDSTKGVYSCAQFLSEGVPFFNDKGITKTASAKGMVRNAVASDKLEAVVVYKTPGVGEDRLNALP